MAAAKRSWVVFLVGVNVGGHRRFRPSLLARELAHLGLINVGAAGTFVVQERVGCVRLCAEIARRLPFESEVMICDGAGSRSGYIDGRWRRSALSVSAKTSSACSRRRAA